MGELQIQIRDAAADDAAGVAELYNYYVINTVATLQEAPLTNDAIAQQIRNADPTHRPYLVAADGNRTLLGFCYCDAMRTRCAYRYTHEISVYVAPDSCRRGIGKALVNTLLARLQHAQVYNLVAAITLPNDSSVKFHQQFGFRHCGTLPQVGYKFQQWRDVAFYLKPYKEKSHPAQK